MANTIIQLKKSGLVGNTPSSLNYGELALNYADGKLFYKNSLGSIVSLTAGLASYSFSTINASSTLILAGSSSDTLSFAGANGVTITGNTSTKTVTVGLNTSSITANLSNYQSVTNATTGTWYPALYNGTSGNRQVNANNALSFNSATGALSATSFNASGITQSTFTDSSGVSTSNQTLKIGNGTNWLAFQANASGGSYNGITTTGDVALWFSNGSGTSSSTPGNLIIAPWAGFNFGLRLNSAANTVAITGSITSTANITASSGTVTASSFSGAGTGLTGTASSLTAGLATNIVGGAANRIPYQTGTNTTGFITAPTQNNTFLNYTTGAGFSWQLANGASVGSANVSTYQTVTNATTGTYYPSLYNATSGDLASYANNALSFNVTSGGFGIGTTSPGTWGKFAVVGANSGGTIVAAIVNTSSTANTQSVLSFDTTNNGFNVRDSQIRATNNGSNQTTLEFFTSNAGTPTEKVRINHLGNLGIGTSSPAYKLDVAGTANTGALTVSSLNITGPSANQIFYEGTSGVASFIAAPTQNNTFLNYQTGTGFSWQLANSASVGSANVSTYQTVTNATTGTYYPALYDGTSGDRQVNANSAFVFNASTGQMGIGGTPSGSVGRLIVSESITPLGANTGDYIPISTELHSAGSNAVYNTRWRLRKANTSTSWTTQALHDGVWIDVSYTIPGSTTRTWWERYPNQGSQSWGDGATTGMTLSSAGALTTTSSVTASSFSGAGTGLTGTASSLNIGGNANNSRSVGGWDGTTYRTPGFVMGTSGGRTVNLTPNTYSYGLTTEFKSSSTFSSTGNYSGLITYAPWDSTTASTGDPSYQLLFSPSAVNSTTNPVLKLRAGIDTTWGSWNTILHSGNYTNYALPSSGGTFSGSVVINGDLNVSGNTTFAGNTSYINVTHLEISDPIIYLGANNYSSDLVSIGFVGNYFNGANNLHTGLFRANASNNYYLFTGVRDELDNVNVISTSANGFMLATLNANISGPSITATGQFSGPGTGLTGTASSLTVGLANDITGGSANQILYQTGTSVTSYISAPSTNNTFLNYQTGAGFSWQAANSTTVGNANVSTYQTVTNATTGTYYPALYNGTSGDRQVNANNALSFNAATGNLGIGTASPGAAKITLVTTGTRVIYGVSSATPSPASQDAQELIQFTNDTAISGLTFSAGDSRLYTIGVDTDNSIFTRASSLSLQGINSINLKTAGGSSRLYINTSGNIGIGTTSPAYKLDVAGTANTGALTTTSISSATLLLDSLYLLDANTFTTSSTAQVSVDSFASATYRSAKYQAQITSGSSYHVIELLLVHNGTTVYLSQYGEIFTGVSLGTFDATITTGTLNLLFTPTNAITTIKVAKNLITV